MLFFSLHVIAGTVHVQDSRAVEMMATRLQVVLMLWSTKKIDSDSCAMFWCILN